MKGKIGSLENDINSNSKQEQPRRCSTREIPSVVSDAMKSNGT